MRTLLLKNVHVIDPEAGVVFREQSIEVRDGLISSVESGPTGAADGFDGQGLYLCPGLIDTHVHLFLDASPEPRRNFIEALDSTKMEIATHNARTALMAGITTVRDCGGPAALVFDFQKKAECGDLLAPHIISCGSPLMRIGGHCHFMGGEVASTKDVGERIDAYLKAGAGFVKLIASGGGLTPGTCPHEADLPLELMRAAAQAAHANGVHITAHCHATESIVRAIDAGLDMIEHANFLSATGDYLFDEHIAQRLADSGIQVGPTVVAALRRAERFRAEGYGLNSNDKNPVGRGMGRFTNVSHFKRLGVRMIAGTDCGLADTPFDSLADELVCYHQAGLSNAEALRMATLYGARLLEKKTGQIKPGYAADMIALNANPLEDLNALRQPQLVFKGGALAYAAAGISILEGLAR